MGNENPETGPGVEIAFYEGAEGEVRVEVRLERETVLARWRKLRPKRSRFQATGASS